MAFGILSILVLRMALHKLPPASMAASSWLALRPIRIGALGMLIMGADAPSLFTAHGLAGVGSVAQGAGVIAGVRLWGSAMVASSGNPNHCPVLPGGVPFNLDWWGYIFLLGIYTLATLWLDTVLHLSVFTAVGAGLVVVLAAFWGLVAAKTLEGG